MIERLIVVCWLLGCSLACADANEKGHTMQGSSEHSATNAKHTNRLIDTNSPYLLSHAHNPVDWYPWAEEALAKAKAEDRPIFLSIGYAACHWCHVMERESFENEKIAKVLNKHFVSIKVDREQRPDLDHIYMAFTQAFSGQGGWPMTVFLTPDLKPFFAGTYFPPQDAMGRPGFMRLITEIAAAYAENKEQIVESADDIHQRLSAAFSVTSQQETLTPDMVTRAAEYHYGNTDKIHGGFGSAPKFPHPVELSLLLRHYRHTGDLSYLQAAEKALTAMARGGINDHLGGGFARYSVDARWLVPHFEKMLYDNALLTLAYADAYQVTGKQLYLDVINNTLGFILREMQDESGGFHSALDADSEGEEGKFYVWSKGEIDRLLGSDAERFNTYYNVSESGNFEGHNILHVTAESDRVRDQAGDDFEIFLDRCREKLLEARSQRVRPATDDKVLTSWNGLALSALARGYQVTGSEEYLQAARKNASFVLGELDQDSMLTHAWRDGRHFSEPFLEDHAFYVRGLIDLYESDFSEDSNRWLKAASDLATRAVDLFMGEDSLFYMRPEGQEDLLLRPRDETDSAIPAAGSVMIDGLLRLARLTGDEELGSTGEAALRAISGSIQRMPQAMTSAVMAVDLFVNDKIEIVIVGDGRARAKMQKVVYQRFLPNLIIAHSSTGKENWPLFEGRAVAKDDVKAYVCRNSVCDLPAETVDQLVEQLQEL